MNEGLDPHITAKGLASPQLEFLMPFLSTMNPLILLVVKAALGFFLSWRGLGIAGIGRDDFTPEQIDKLEEIFSVEENRDLVKNKIEAWSASLSSSKTAEELAYKVGYMRGLQAQLTDKDTANLDIFMLGGSDVPGTD